MFKSKPKIQLSMERKNLPMVVPQNLPMLKIPENQDTLRLKRTADREIGELDAMLNRLHRLDSDINKLLNESNNVERNVVSNLRGKSRKGKSGKVRSKVNKNKLKKNQIRKVKLSGKVVKKVSRKVKLKVKSQVRKKVNVKRKKVSKKSSKRKR